MIRHVVLNGSQVETRIGNGQDSGGWGLVASRKRWRWSLPCAKFWLCSPVTRATTVALVYDEGSRRVVVGFTTHTAYGIEKRESESRFRPGFPIWAVSKLKGQSKRDGGIIVRSCKASQSPVYPIRDAILALNHASCPSLSSSGPRQWGGSALKTSRLPGALSLLAKSWLYPPSAWRRR